MKISRVLIAFSVTYAVSAAEASPEFQRTIRIETPEADLFVVPPLNRWHPNSRQQESSFNLATKGAPQLFGPGVRSVDLNWQKNRRSVDEINIKDDEPLMRQTVQSFAAAEIKAHRGAFLQYRIAGPMSELTSQQASILKQLQQNAFLRSATMASPDSQENQALATNFVNAIVGLALNAYISNAMTGSVNPVSVAGSSVTLNELPYKFYASGSLLGVSKEIGLPTDLYEVAVLAPSAVDFSKYKSIQYRWITLTAHSSKVSGEIFIAYKGDRTPELEDRLQALALSAAMGFDQPDGTIKAVRIAERQERQKIWDDCLAANACKKE